MTGPRIVAALYFLAYAVCVTWPVMTLVNRVEPLVLGLPFNMVWIAGWIVGSGFVLWWLHRSEERRRRSVGGPPSRNPEA